MMDDEELHDIVEEGNVPPWRRRRTINPPAVTSELEEVRSLRIKKFAGFRVGANKRVKKAESEISTVP